MAGRGDENGSWANIILKWALGLLQVMLVGGVTWMTAVLSEMRTDLTRVYERQVSIKERLDKMEDQIRDLGRRSYIEDQRGYDGR